jgi:hypothetical protein
MNLIKLVNASVRFLIGSTLRATNQNRVQIFWANRNARPPNWAILGYSGRSPPKFGGRVRSHSAAKWPFGAHGTCVHPPHLDPGLGATEEQQMKTNGFLNKAMGHHFARARAAGYNPRARAAGYGAPALSNYCKGAGKQQNKNKENAHAAGYGAPALSNYCKGGGKQQNKNP